MKKLSLGIVAIDQNVVTLFSDFESDGEMWSGQGPREKLILVQFSKPFRSVPSVHLSLSMLDMDSAYNQRFDIEAAEITPNGFTIVFRTWADTRIARARASWLAIGEVADEDDWHIL